MTLILMDGFDLYSASSEATRLWTSVTATTIGTSAPRTGRANLVAGSIGSYLIRDFSAGEEHATLILGTGVFRPVADDTEIWRLNSDTGGTIHTSVNLDINGAIRVNRSHRGGTTLGTSASAVVPANTWHYVEAKITLSDTVGVATIKVDGVQVLNLTSADTKNAGTKTVYDRVYFGNIDSASSRTTSFDDVYICNGAGSVHNDFLGECKVRTLYPNGNGATSVGVGSDANSVNNYLLVNDTTPVTGSATYVDLAATNDTDTYTFDDLPDITGTVSAVQISTYADKTDAGARSLAHVTRIGGTDYPSADIGLGTSFGWQTTRQAVSPATATAFTRAEVNGAEFGMKAR